MIRHDAWPRTPSGTSCADVRRGGGPVRRRTPRCAAGSHRRPRRARPARTWSSRLEIGCGTGKATRPLAERGYSILGVELGANLAEVARRKVADFPHVEIVTSSFEEWDPGRERFDAVVSFNAFHWLDPDVRFAKFFRAESRRITRRVRLALLRSRRCRPRVAGASGRPRRRARRRKAVLPSRRQAGSLGRFHRNGHFVTVARKTYLWNLTYSAQGYVQLLATMSTHRTLPDDVREELFARIERRIRAAGGSVRPTRGDVLYVATTA